MNWRNIIQPLFTKRKDSEAWSDIGRGNQYHHLWMGSVRKNYDDHTFSPHWSVIMTSKLIKACPFSRVQSGIFKLLLLLKTSVLIHRLSIPKGWLRTLALYYEVWWSMMSFFFYLFCLHFFTKGLDLKTVRVQGLQSRLVQGGASRLSASYWHAESMFILEQSVCLFMKGVDHNTPLPVGFHWSHTVHSSSGPFQDHPLFCVFFSFSWFVQLNGLVLPVCSNNPALSHLFFFLPNDGLILQAKTQPV